jgi:hypothetical protein
MDKFAYSEMFGREIATRAFVSLESQDLEKSAENDEDIDEGRFQVAASLADDLTYRKQQQKLARKEGAVEMLDTFEEALEKGASADALLQEVQEAKTEMQKEAKMRPNSDEEDEEMFGRMVKGACEAWSSLTGQEIDEDMQKQARDLVAQHLQ